MTMVAPPNKGLQRKVRELSNETFVKQRPMVYYLGANGKVLAAVDPSEVDRGELLAGRTELLTSGQLKAIVETVVIYQGILQMSWVEVFDGGDTTDIFALVTWPATQRWINVPEVAQIRWRNDWT
jgi:hypothetical protein